MADQHNANIPALANNIQSDVTDIKENLEFHKDAFENITSGWSNTDATTLGLQAKNDAYITAIDAAGTGTVNLIKANSSDQVDIGFPIVVNSVVQGLDVTAALHRKIVEIGDWNMDSTASVDIAHGLTKTKIRAVSAILRDDADSNYYPITPGGTVYPQVYIGTITDTVVQIYRLSGGELDGANFNSTSYNRGWIVIHYTD